MQISESVFNSAEVAAVAGMTDYDMARRVDDGSLTPSVSRGRRGRGGEGRRYSNGDLVGALVLGRCRALGMPPRVSKVLVNAIAALPGFKGRHTRTDGATYLAYEDFPEKAYFDGETVRFKQPPGDTYLVVEVRRAVGVALMLCNILQQEPDKRFDRLRAIAKEKSPAGAAACEMLNDAVLGGSEGPKRLATILRLKEGMEERVMRQQVTGMQIEFSDALAEARQRAK